MAEMIGKMKHTTEKWNEVTYIPKIERYGISKDMITENWWDRNTKKVLRILKDDKHFNMYLMIL